MTRCLIPRRFLVLTAGAVVLPLGVASADGPPDLLWQGERFAVHCQDHEAELCGTGTGDPRTERAFQRGEQLGKMAEEVARWFETLGFPERYRIESTDGRYRINYAHDEAVPTDCRNANGCYSGSARTFYMLDSAFERDVVARTMAHEMAHAKVGLDRSDQLLWLDEAIAEAVGLAFADQRLGFSPQPLIHPPRFPGDLDVPFHSGTSGGYERGAYMKFLGQELGSVDTVGYVRTYFNNLYRDPSNRGMLLLYEGPEGELGGTAAFDSVFPQYVARLNSAEYGQILVEVDDGGDEPAYEIATRPLYFTEIAEWSLAPIPLDSGLTVRHDGTVEPFAADPVLMDAFTFTGREEVPETERLVVVTLELDDADRPEHLSLAFEHDLAEDHRVRYLMLAGDEDDASQSGGGAGLHPVSGPFLRVVNAAAERTETAAQSYRLQATFERSRIHAPGCVETGSSVPFEVSGAGWEDVDNISIEVSAGSLDGLTYTAPSHPTEVEATLSIGYPLTRTKYTLGPWDRGSVELDLGTIDVVDGGCAIRMTVDALDGAAMIYTSDGDYTEYQALPYRTFVGSGDRMAFHDPEQGWVEMSHIAAMAVPEDLALGLVERLAPDVVDAENYMARMPLYLTTALEWERVVDAAGVTADAIPTSSVACPTGGAGCVEVTLQHDGLQGQVIYDDARRVVGIRFPDGNLARFTHGSMDLMRPPGW